VNSELELDAQDVIDVLTLQRNAAMDEVVKQGALIRKLLRERKAKADEEKSEGQA